MAKTIEEMSLAEFAEQHPDMYGQIHDQAYDAGKADGESEARQTVAERNKQLSEACGDDHELFRQCVIEGKDSQTALKLRAEKLQKDNKQLSEQLAAASKPKVDAAVQEFTETTNQPDKFNEDSATNEQLKERFAKTQQLQDEFHDIDAYLAYVHQKRKKQN